MRSNEGKFVAYIASCKRVRHQILRDDSPPFDSRSQCQAVAPHLPNDTQARFYPPCHRLSLIFTPHGVPRGSIG